MLEQGHAVASVVAKNTDDDAYAYGLHYVARVVCFGRVSKEGELTLKLRREVAKWDGQG